MLTIAIFHIGIYIFFRMYIGEISKTSTIIISLVTIFAVIILFISYFLLLTKKFVVFIKKISEGIDEISLGNFDNRIMINNYDEFAHIAGKLNQMADDIKEIMENERRSEYAKNELITSITHDLRTPLTSIIGYLDLASAKEFTDEAQKKYIEVAYSKSKRLEKLIDDLFTYTKFNFGEVKANYTEVDLVKLIDQLLEEFYPIFGDNHLEYEFFSNQSSILIWADGDLLARALANLISNAITYGKNGKNIIIYLELINDEIIVSIKNFGDIIPKEDLELIFQKFYRVESSRSSETGGSGLGLAIAQSIVEMHGGKITVLSDENGTNFTIVLKNKLN